MFVLHDLGISSVNQDAARQRFREADSADNGGDGNGFVSLDELKAQLRRENPEISQAEIDVTIARYKFYDPGMKMQFSEFEFMIASLLDQRNIFNEAPDPEKTKKYLDLFHLLDANQDRIVTTNEGGAVIGLASPEERARYAFDFQVTDGIITLGEFMAVMTKVEPRIGERYFQADADHDNHVTGPELLDDLRKEYPNATYAELQVRLRYYMAKDLDLSGGLSLQEFIAARNAIEQDTRTFNSRLALDIIRTGINSFQSNDLNKDGVLGPEEIEKIIDPNDSIRSYLNCNDVDQDGVVSLGENLGVINFANPYLIDQIVQVFDRYDAPPYRNGRLHGDQLKKAIKALTSDLTPAQRRDIYRRLVREHGQVVDTAEFVTFMFNELTGNNAPAEN